MPASTCPGAIARHGEPCSHGGRAAAKRRKTIAGGVSRRVRRAPPIHSPDGAEESSRRPKPPGPAATSYSQSRSGRKCWAADRGRPWRGTGSGGGRGRRRGSGRIGPIRPIGPLAARPQEDEASPARGGRVPRSNLFGRAPSRWSTRHVPPFPGQREDTPKLRLSVAPQAHRGPFPMIPVGFSRAGAAGSAQTLAPPRRARWGPKCARALARPTIVTRVHASLAPTRE